MADLSGDGHDDMISGSYWPGELWIFRGRGDGSFEKGEPMKDADGKNLHAGPEWKSKDALEMESLASAPHAWDFDADGDLDLLVGNILGTVILIPNTGSAAAPKFDKAARRAVEADGKPLKVDGDSGPVVADWDHDGTPDLIVGSGDGAVWFYRNTGKKGSPVFAKGEPILPKSTQGYENQAEHGAAPAGPGVRTKVCVTDWNGDGRQDLLVGDLWYEKAAAKMLTAEETARRDELHKRQDGLNERILGLSKKSGDQAKDDPELQKVYGELSDVYNELSKLEPRSTPHGSVWLYLRKPR